MGTVRRDRIPNNKLPTVQDLKSEPRGISYEFVACIDGTEISNVVWKDNKLVTLLSTFAGQHPIHENTKRYDRKEKKNIIIMFPNVIKQYNKFMGGVDLIDSLLGRYKITLKSRKWYMRIFYHLIQKIVAGRFYSGGNFDGRDGR